MASSLDQRSPCRGLARNESFDDAVRDAGNAVGLAAVVAEGELVEVSLEVLAPEPWRADTPKAQTKG